jgi:hypothetical protein
MTRTWWKWLGGRLPHAPEDRPLRRVRPKSCRPGVEVLEGRLLLATFVVTNTNDSGPGSFRQAIMDANQGPNNTIAFNIGGGGVQTIRPASILPGIARQEVIDGTTQPGFAGTPLIVSTAAA